MNEPANDLNPEMGELVAVPDQAHDAEDAMSEPMHFEAIPNDMLLLIMGLLENDRMALELRAQRAVNRRWEFVYHKFTETDKVNKLCFVLSSINFNFDLLQERTFGEFNLEKLVKIRLKPAFTELNEPSLADYYQNVTQLIINERYLGIVQHWPRITHLTLTNEANLTGLDPSNALNGLIYLEYLDLNGPYLQHYENMRPTLQRIKHLSVSWKRHERRLNPIEDRQSRSKPQNPIEGFPFVYLHLARFFGANCTRLWFTKLPIMNIKEWQLQNPDWFGGITHLGFDFPTKNGQLESLEFILNHMPALHSLHLGRTTLRLTDLTRNIGRMAHLRDLQLVLGVISDLRDFNPNVNLIPCTSVRTLKLILKYWQCESLVLFMTAISAIFPNVQHLNLNFPYDRTFWFHAEYNIGQYVNRFPLLLSFKFECINSTWARVAAQRRQLGDNFIDLMDGVAILE